MTPEHAGDGATVHWIPDLPDPEHPRMADLARASPLTGIAAVAFLSDPIRVAAEAEAERIHQLAVAGARWSVPMQVTDVDRRSLLAYIGHLLPHPPAAAERTRSRRWRAGTRRTKRHAHRRSP